MYSRGVKVMLVSEDPSSNCSWKLLLVHTELLFADTKSEHRIKFSKVSSINTC